MNNEKNNMTSQIDKETGAGEMMGSEAVIKQGNVMGAGKIVNTKEIAISAVFIALTYVFTWWIDTSWQYTIVYCSYGVWMESRYVGRWRRYGTI